MSTAELALVLNGLGRTEARALRVVLLSGDSLTIPRSMKHLRVLSGTAWISQRGRDVILPEGECFTAEAGGDAALVSALGGKPLLVEVR